MKYPRGTLVWRFVIFSLVLSISAFPNTARAQTKDDESLEGFMKGLRANAVQGQVTYKRQDGKFDVDAGLKLEEGDLIKTGSNSFAELLLQPGNYLRLGSETEFQIFSDDHDKMRLKLNEGTINLEILLREFGNFTSFYYTRSQVYELIRVITPGAEVFVSQTGIFRITAVPGGRTEVIVREGEAVINGQRIKKKRRAVAYNNDVNITEIETKTEDAFDLWGRERARQLVEANRLLKKDDAWTKKRKDGEETTVDLDETEDQEKKTTASVYVVSAKPGTVNFVEDGVEFIRPSKDWQPLTEKSQLQAGDKLRTHDHSFVELSVLPDIHLRLTGNSEVSFEELSYESISIKLTRGSAIFDVTRFDRKQVPQVTFAGPATSVVIAEDGNYRLDVKPNGDEVIVRDGKVHLKDRSVGRCNKITVASVRDCDKRMDNFDLWSEHRGEGQIFTGRQYMSMVNHLARIRRYRFRNSGFWFQNPGKTHYTFVPFTSSYFKSPYGGTYSTVLTTRRPTIRRVDMGNPLPRRFPAPQVIRP